MRDMEKLCNIIEDELNKIAEKGLNTGNLETAYKLIDMYKDMKNTEYWDTKCEYYMAVLDEMQGGYSERGVRNGGYSENGGYSRNMGQYSQRRDSMGRYSRADGGNSYDGGSSYARRGEHYVREHYSRADGGNDAYDDYMMEKQSYRTGGKTTECKQRMLNALQNHLEILAEEIGEIGRDADCNEEREKVMRFADKLKKMI